MQKRVLRVFLLLLFVFGIMLIYPNNQGHVQTEFSDVSEHHWAKAAIDSAVKSGIVRGFADGTFKPNDYVTESQFLAMLIRSFPNDIGKTSPWHKAYYDFSEKMNYPIYKKPDRIIHRFKAAEIIAGANGVHYKSRNAVIYVLGTGLANGKVPGDITLDNFKGEDLLTRAEAVVFIANAKEKGLKELKEMPVQKGDFRDLPRSPLNPKEREMTNKIEELVTKYGYNLGDVYFKADDILSAGIENKDGDTVVTYSHTSGTHQMSGEDTNDKESIKLFVELAVFFGIPVSKDGVIEGINEAIENEREYILKIGTKKIGVVNLGTAISKDGYSMYWVEMEH